MWRKICLGATTLALAVSLAACAAGQGMAVPSREVSISVESALDAQSMAMAAFTTGSVTWTESQFSSLLTELLRANSGAGNPVETITAWFEPGVVYLRVDLKEGVLPAAVGDTLELAGALTTTDGKLTLDLMEAAAGTYEVGGMILAPINAQINAILAAQLPAAPVSVEMTQGAVTVSLVHS
jgi:hypothetical protein